MKKRLIITLTMMLVFVLVLALSAFAKDINTGLTDTSGNPIVLPTYDSDGDSLTWYRVTTEPTNGTYYTYVSGENTYYIVSVKTKIAAYVNDDYYLCYSYDGLKAGAWSGNIMIMNLDGIKHADGNGPQKLNFVCEGTPMTYAYIPASMTALVGKNGNKESSIFYACSSLVGIDFEAGSQITEMRTNGFYNCKKLTSIVLPENLTTIQSNAFVSLNLELTVPKSVTTFEVSQWASLTINFTGAEETVAEWTYQPSSVKYVNHCDVYYGSTHKNSEKLTCIDAIACVRCGLIKTPALGHDFAIANGAKLVGLTYESFDGKGTKHIQCARVGCDEISTDEKAGEIITFKGYSVPENASYKGINAGFRIDKELLRLYNELNEVDASLALFMVSSKNQNANIEKILDGETLELVDGVKGINVKIESVNYTSISIEARGFDDSTDKGSFYTLTLITAIAVKTEDGVHYVQAGLKNSPNTTITIEEIDFNIVSANNIYYPISQS